MKKIFFLLGILLLGGCSGADKKEKNLIQDDYAFIRGVNFHHLELFYKLLLDNK